MLLKYKGFFKSDGIRQKIQDFELRIVGSGLTPISICVLEGIFGKRLIEAQRIVTQFSQIKIVNSPNETVKHYFEK